jgi:hypothetical protein
MSYRVDFRANDKKTLESVIVDTFEGAKDLCSDYMDKIIDEWESKNDIMLSERDVVDNMKDKGYYFEGYLFMRADGKRGYIETFIEKEGEQNV